MRPPAIAGLQGAYLRPYTQPVRSMKRSFYNTRSPIDFHGLNSCSGENFQKSTPSKINKQTALLSQESFNKTRNDTRRAQDRSQVKEVQ